MVESGSGEAVYDWSAFKVKNWKKESRFDRKAGLQGIDLGLGLL